MNETCTGFDVCRVFCRSEPVIDIVMYDIGFGIKNIIEILEKPSEINKSIQLHSNLNCNI